MDEYEIIKKRKKEKKKVKISGIILISFIVLVITIMVIIVIKGYYKKASSITFNEEYVLYQYSANEKFTFTGSIVLTKNGEITKIDTKDFKGELDEDYPLYFNNIRNSCLIFSAKFILTAAVYLRFRVQFGMNFKPDDCFPFAHYISPPAIFSKADAIASSRLSENFAPISWTASGIPSAFFPYGRLTAGIPERFAGTVHRSAAYRCTGDTFSSSRREAVG